MKPLPIRLRLTIWYSVLFASAALLLSSASWWMLRSAIDTGIRQDLQERVDDARMQLHLLDITPASANSQARLDAVYHFRDDGKWLQIADQNGRWIYRSSRMMMMDRPFATFAEPAPVSSFREFDQGSRHVRCFQSRIQVDGRTYIVETGIATNKQAVLLSHFGIGLLLLTPAVFAVAVFAGHWMSRKALVPIAAIANEARRISEHNLDRRLPVSAAQDEVAHLSVTLNNMLGRIDAGFRSVRDFTANASHELRTPLALLRTETEVALLKTRSTSEYRETLEHVQAAAIEMTSLIESLLNLARKEAGAENLPLSRVDVFSLAASLFEEWLPVTRRLGLELQLAPDRSRSSMAAGNRLALLQVLRIWMDNACKFTPSGGVIVICVQAKQSLISLGVQDSGVGIPMSEQARIFERFYRIEKDQANLGKGLGLSLAAWIAAQHGSRIEVVSAPGKGSTFSLTLQAFEKDEVPGPRSVANKTSFPSKEETHRVGIWCR